MQCGNRRETHRTLIRHNSHTDTSPNKQDPRGEVSVTRLHDTSIPRNQDGHFREAHALFEETLEPEVLMPLLDTSRLKPEYQGYKRLQVAVDSGASASVMPESHGT